MSEMPDPESSADRIVASLHNVDEKVNALREQRINDPDDLCDKMFKVAAPTLAGLVFGKPVSYTHLTLPTNSRV